MKLSIVTVVKAMVDASLAGGGAKVERRGGKGGDGVGGGVLGGVEGSEWQGKSAMLLDAAASLVDAMAACAVCAAGDDIITHARPSGISHAYIDALSHTWQRVCQILYRGCEICTFGVSHPAPGVAKLMPSLVSPRPQCSDGAEDGKGARAPTLLTSQAAECCTSICTSLALALQSEVEDRGIEGAGGFGSRDGGSKAAAARREVVDGQDVLNPLRAVVDLSRSMSLLLREMGEWYAAKRPLLSQGLVAFSQVGLFPTTSPSFLTAVFACSHTRCNSSSLARLRWPLESMAAGACLFSFRRPFPSLADIRSVPSRRGWGRPTRD